MWTFIQLLFLGAAVLTAAQNCTLDPADIASQKVVSCLTAANVPQALPNSDSFEFESDPYNVRVVYEPAAIALPTTIAHVQAAVSCGSQNGVRVSAKSGGHSYASFGLGGEDGHLIVDFKYMHNVTVDNTTKVVTIQPGARLGNVAQALYAQGKRAMAHGTCPAVGIGGLSLHGGYGYSSRLHGLTLDNLVGAQVVIANGSLVTASATANPDLFWALRGAGSSCGIVVSFHFKTFPAPKNNVVFSYNFPASTVNETTQSIMAIQNFGNTQQPAELNMRVLCNGYQNQLIGVYYGKTKDFQVTINPLLKELGIASGSVRNTSWIDMLSTYAYGSLTVGLDYNVHESFFSKSMMTPLLPAAAVKAWSEYLVNTARGVTRSWYILMDLHGGKGSAVTSVANNATAYGHRDSLLKFELFDQDFTGDYPASGFSFLNGWVNATLSGMDPADMGMYINYADTSLTLSQAHHYYWMDNYARLLELKQVWDPTGMFTYPQGVGS